MTNNSEPESFSVETPFGELTYRWIEKLGNPLLLKLHEWHLADPSGKSIEHIWESQSSLWTWHKDVYIDEKFAKKAVKESVKEKYRFLFRSKE